MSQIEFAKMIGVGIATVQRAESGRVAPKRATVMAWAMATGVDLDWLENGWSDGRSSITGGWGFEYLRAHHGRIFASNVAYLDDYRAEQLGAAA